MGRHAKRPPGPRAGQHLLSVGAWTLGGRDMAQGNPLFLAERASVSQWQGEVERPATRGCWLKRPG